MQAIQHSICRHCGLIIQVGDPHNDGSQVWYHSEHGGITCGSLAEGKVAEPGGKPREGHYS